MSAICVSVSVMLAAAKTTSSMGSGAGSGMTSGGDLGPLPAGSRALLIGLAAVWALLGLYAGLGWLKRRKQ